MNSPPDYVSAPLDRARAPNRVSEATLEYLNSQQMGCRARRGQEAHRHIRRARLAVGQLGGVAGEARAGEARAGVANEALAAAELIYDILVDQRGIAIRPDASAQGALKQDAWICSMAFRAGAEIRSLCLLAECAARGAPYPLGTPAPDPKESRAQFTGAAWAVPAGYASGTTRAVPAGYAQ